MISTFLTVQFMMQISIGPYWFEVDGWESMLLRLESRMSIKKKLPV